MSAPFDASVNLLRALLWRDSGALKFQKYMEIKSALANQRISDFMDSWVRDVLNVDTANEFGLAVWSRILDVNLQVKAEQGSTKQNFGFGANNLNFNRGNFGTPAGSVISLTLEQQRLVIKLRLYQLTGRAAVFEVNAYLKELLGDDAAYAYDPLNMTFITYFFSETPSQQLRFILSNYDLLPRPAGVGVQWVVAARPSFGFSPYGLNFNRGNFGA